MRDLGSTIRTHRIYFGAFILLVIAGSLLLLIQGKTTAFITLNTYHPFWLNVFFINYTFMGDGIFALCLAGLYLFYFKKRRTGLALLYTFLLSGAIVQLIKNLINSPRPKLFFEPGRYANFINDISLTNNSSFPSGHTAMAFALATVFVLMMRNKNWQLPVLVAAAMAGYSRIYLAQHFLGDVLMGACIGTCSGLVAYMLVSVRIRFRKFSRPRMSYWEHGDMAYN
jgi:membrane-associated phospholipid phosphatase